MERYFERVNKHLIQVWHIINKKYHLFNESFLAMKKK